MYRPQGCPTREGDGAPMRNTGGASESWLGCGERQCVPRVSPLACVVSDEPRGLAGDGFGGIADTAGLRRGISTSRQAPYYRIGDGIHAR